MRTVESCLGRGTRITLGLVLLLLAGSFSAVSSQSRAQTKVESATGPLRLLQANPRYFTDGSGKAIYLAGSHNWHNFQDNGHRLPEGKDPPQTFDFDAYLDFLQAHHHNFLKLWAILPIISLGLVSQQPGRITHDTPGFFLPPLLLRQAKGWRFHP
jgi:hypothetical protein